jgi:hypothetical protein
MDFKTMDIGAIIAWCQANNQVAWLKDEMKKLVPCKVYPKVMKDGKKVADKSATPTVEMRPISFIQVRNDFCNKFMPEIMPKKKDKKPSMYELVAAL